MTTTTATIDKTRYDSIRSARERANKSIGNKYKSWNDYIWEYKYEPHQSKTVESTAYNVPWSETKTTKNNYKNNYTYDWHTYTAKTTNINQTKSANKPLLSDDTKDVFKGIGLVLLAILWLIIWTFLEWLPLYIILKALKK